MKPRNMAAAAVAAVTLALLAPAEAADVQLGVRTDGVGAPLVLACENGGNYPIQPLAVSREGDLVTGYMLRIGTGRTVHLRLVPMGDGYRYEGGGVWFDGTRDQAVLWWGTPHEVPCVVLRQQ
jgi:hypothetical protein